MIWKKKLTMKYMHARKTHKSLKLVVEAKDSLPNGI